MKVKNLLILGMFLVLLGCTNTIEEVVYAINFNSMGGTEVDTIYLEVGSHVPEPSTTKASHELLGWYTEPNHQNEWDFDNDLVSDSITLYAKWQADNITLTYKIYDNLLNPDDGFRHAALGVFHTVALTSDRRVLTWGENHHGILGDGTNIDRKSPHEITQYFDFNENEFIGKVTSGHFHAGAFTSENRAFIWGNNTRGQLGDGTTLPRKTPIDITPMLNLESDEFLFDLVMSSFNTAVLTSNYRLLIWGANNYGQIGNGTTENQLTPLDITNQFDLKEDEKIMRVVLGNYNNIVITSEHRVFSWGADFYVSDEDYQLNPIDITDLFDLEDNEIILRLASSCTHSLFLTDKGRLFSKTLSYNEQTPDESFFKIEEITDDFPLFEDESILYLDVNEASMMVKTSEGRIFAWGQNTHGQLGTGNNDYQSKPVDVTDNLGFDGFVMRDSFSLGVFHASAIRLDGTLVMWGANMYGQLGKGTTEYSYDPVKPNLSTLIEHVKITLPYDTKMQHHYYTPVKEGYAFDGWYTDKNLEIQFELNHTIDHDLILYGRWIRE